MLRCEKIGQTSLVDASGALRTGDLVSFLYSLLEQYFHGDFYG